MQLAALDPRNLLLKAVHDRLCLFRKMLQGNNRRSPLQKAGPVKDYVDLSIVICINVRLGVRGAPDYQFLFHRVPRAPRVFLSTNMQSEAALPSMDQPLPLPPNDNLLGDGGNDQPNGVFGVGYLGHFADKIVASGVGITSGVWLLPFDTIPKLPRNGGAFLTPLEAPDQIGGGVFSPRVVTWTDGPRDCFAGREDSLVEAMPQIVDGLGPPPGNNVRGRFPLHELERVFSQIFVELFDEFEGFLVFGESSKSRRPFIDCFVCPFDQITRLLK